MWLWLLALVTGEILQVTCDKWHVTSDTRHRFSPLLTVFHRFKKNSTIFPLHFSMFFLVFHRFPTVFTLSPLLSKPSTVFHCISLFKQSFSLFSTRFHCFKPFQCFQSVFTVFNRFSQFSTMFNPFHTFSNVLNHVQPFLCSYPQTPKNSVSPACRT